MSNIITEDEWIVSNRQYRNKVVIADDIKNRIANDCDIHEYACGISDSFFDGESGLLDNCDVVERIDGKRDRYTMVLVEIYAAFVVCNELLVDRTFAYESTEYCVNAFVGYKIHLRDDKWGDEIRKSLRDGIKNKKGTLYTKLEQEMAIERLASIGIKL